MTTPSKDSTPEIHFMGSSSRKGHISTTPFFVWLMAFVFQVAFGAGLGSPPNGTANADGSGEKTAYAANDPGRVAGKVGWFDLERVFLLSPAIREIDPAAGTVVDDGIKRERARVNKRLGELSDELSLLRQELSLKRRVSLASWTIEKDTVARELIMSDLDRCEEDYLSAMKPLKEEMVKQKEALSALTGDLNLGDFMRRAANSLFATIEGEMKTSGIELAIDSSRLGNLDAARASSASVRVPYQNEGIWLKYIDSKSRQAVTDATASMLLFRGSIYSRAAEMAVIPELMGPVSPVNMTTGLIIKSNGIDGPDKGWEKK